MATIFSLPDEILLEVFLYLNITDIAMNIANVCTHWKILASDLHLWSCLQFTVDKNMELQHALNTVMQLPLLQLVNLQWRTDSYVIINVLCDYCPNLTEINLICCGFVSRNCVRKLYEKFQDLDKFSLGKCWAVPKQCLDDVSLLSNLTVLNLSNSLLTSQQFISISLSCKKLTSINIDYVRGISEDNLVQFLSLRTDQLKSLSVFGELLSDNIFKNISLCRKLKLLHISSSQRFSDSCFEYICKLKCLNSFTMRKCINLTSRGLWRFYFLSGIVKNLSHLYISAKRTVKSDDIALWSGNCCNIDSCLINQYCICILTRDGFKIEKILYSG